MNGNPARHDITVYKGAPWESPDVSIADGDGIIDLTGYSALGQVRSSPDSFVVLAEFTITFSNDRKSFRYSMLQTQVDRLKASPSPMQYDIKLTKAGDDSATLFPLFGIVTAKNPISKAQGNSGNG